MRGIIYSVLCLLCTDANSIFTRHTQGSQTRLWIPELEQHDYYTSSTKWHNLIQETLSEHHRRKFYSESNFNLGANKVFKLLTW